MAHRVCLEHWLGDNTGMLQREDRTHNSKAQPGTCKWLGTDRRVQSPCQGKKRESRRSSKAASLRPHPHPKTPGLLRSADNKKLLRIAEAGRLWEAIWARLEAPAATQAISDESRARKR